MNEKPFELLRRKDNSCFSPETIANWYKARKYVLTRLQDIAFTPEENNHLHVVIIGDNPLLLAVVRQVALSAHYINYRERNEDIPPVNKTLITLVSERTDIVEELKKEEYLCNLPVYGRNFIRGAHACNNPYAIDLDLEMEIVSAWEDNSDKEAIIFTQEDIVSFCNQLPHDEIFTIDTSKAVYTDRMYQLGETLDNLPAEDIHSVQRYSMALSVFQYEKMKGDLKPMFKGDGCQNARMAKLNISNLFCSDSYESRQKSIQRCKSDDKEPETKIWEKNNVALCVSEHARWITEKLIMGYRPLNSQERYYDESLSVLGNGKELRKQYRKTLKRNSSEPAHIDLCSYAELRRINPDDLKFDSFLMLAIPKILEKIKMGNHRLSQ